MTSTLESFTVGHTIVLSRGLIDVLPDEASLATMLAHELSHVVLGHRVDSQYAFLTRSWWKIRTLSAIRFLPHAGRRSRGKFKAILLLNNSPY
jgi:Putative Zn-dependent protease